MEVEGFLTSWMKVCYTYNQVELLSFFCMSNIRGAENLRDKSISTEEDQ